MDALSSRIHWGGFFDDFEVRYREPPGSEGELDPDCPPVDELIASALFRPEVLARFAPHDLYGPAVARIQQVVNKHLSGILVHLEWNQELGRLESRSSPKNLLDAMWLQFAESVHSGNAFRACRSCGAWFELTPDIARASRVYCTTACRNRAYRERQKQACEMNAEGRPLKEIALELDTGIKTVKKWIQAAKE